ncbi:TAXI family TRAP transporter solute-binding subunit [Rickettsiales endosymbiont of Stachyamoeba lipophora]|uniref:TAXI family TRAP transporter solute-binding subunit n=1 Tax=Rickettsiales endosymbiont of Stachyamoeba lipophora TaxID=2486578 RepID=UPI000F64C906|nr:TAXI family TRAP transporter solute-binding subunit [Rickettsiales endosymbiont of Stachyamoeba lipophora]AZL15374.1 TAXI family TRAP transporter solute-binding subunit [Rickettsiales endosymbiont of Stachyamoeba lipophora]
MFLKVVWFILFLTYSSFLNADSDINFNIGAGRKIGNYHLIAEEICAYFNSNKQQRCNVVISKGSHHNLDMLSNNKIDFAFLQYDHLIDYNKYAKANQKITPIVRLYNETLTIITTADSSINNFYDLKGKTVSTNGPNGGSRTVINYLARNLGHDFKINFADHIVDNHLINKLCNKKIDALSLMVSHPNILVNEINNECPIKFVEIPNNLINNLSDLQELGYFKFVIPDSVYKGIIYPTLTIGTHNMIVANSKESDPLVYNLLQVTYDILYSNTNKSLIHKVEGTFRKPPEEMHPSAERFFLKIEEKVHSLPNHN